MHTTIVLLTLYLLLNSLFCTYLEVKNEGTLYITSILEAVMFTMISGYVFYN